MPGTGAVVGLAGRGSIVLFEVESSDVSVSYWCGRILMRRFGIQCRERTGLPRLHLNVPFRGDFTFRNPILPAVGLWRERGLGSRLTVSFL